MGGGSACGRACDESPETDLFDGPVGAHQTSVATKAGHRGSGGRGVNDRRMHQRACPPPRGGRQLPPPASTRLRSCGGVPRAARSASTPGAPVSRPLYAPASDEAGTPRDVLRRARPTFVWCLRRTSRRPTRWLAGLKTRAHVNDGALAAWPSQGFPGRGARLARRDEGADRRPPRPAGWGRPTKQQRQAECPAPETVIGSRREMRSARLSRGRDRQTGGCLD